MTTKTATRKTSSKHTAPAFSADERAAMHARSAEVRAVRGKRTDKAAIEAQALLDAIAAMPPADRTLATRLHTLVIEAAPELEPRTWYGMPAYAKGGRVVCFFKAASKFKTRYATLGFEEAALIDDGTMWPTSFGITALTEADERKISKLVKKAVG